MPDLEREYAFLSYAHEDLEKVRKVYEGLKKREVNVWFDKEDIKQGRWKPQILKAIRSSKYFVICLSNAALEKLKNKKGVQHEEFYFAYDLAINQPEDKFTIVPVRLEDCERGDRRLIIYEQYDLFEDWEGVLDELTVNLGGISLSDATAKDERTEYEKALENVIKKGFMFYNMGEYDTALSYVESAIKLKPDDNEAWYVKGVSLDALGRHEEALKAYDKAIELNPDLAASWTNKGAALDALGRHEEALKAYDKAIELNPDLAASWTNKGVALAALGRYEDALKAYEKAIELNPDSPESWNLRGVALQTLGRHEEALEAYDKALELNPDLTASWANKGAAFAALGRYEEASKSYSKAHDVRISKKYIE